jgi:putative membrane-bound dehydrogenase-like protein
MRQLALLFISSGIALGGSLSNTETDTSAPLMPAAEAAAKLKLPLGFTATVFAHEPAVQNPIATAWDKKGRLWVAENYTYAERSVRFDLSLKDRVLILDDGDGDGVAECRKVFTDEVQMLTSVELGRGGVWLLCPPQLVFLPDANGDDVPDGPPQVMLDGFTVAKDNYHNFANGLRWGPDGWLYGRCGHSCPGRLGLPGTADEARVPMDGGIWRFHPERRVVEVLCHGTTNSWGHDWDAQGELFFINTVNGHLWHMMPGAHLLESFGLSENPRVYERLDTIADHFHFDTKGSWQDSRDGKANDLGGGHAHVGMMICQEPSWPQQFQGRLLTLNMHGRRANVERLERLGAGYVGRHEPDAFLSADPWFRGTEISIGPDGCAYMVDYSDTGECHEATGVHRESGRIYRIKHGAGVPRAKEDFVTPRCLAGSGSLPQLWKDYQAGQTSAASLRQLLATATDEHLRAWAVRLLTDSWPLDTLMGQRPQRSEAATAEDIAALITATEKDSSGLVHLVLASALQRLPQDRRAALATALVRHSDYAADRHLPSLVWYGIHPLPAEAVVRISSASQWPALHRWAARLAFSGTHKEAQDLLLSAQGIDTAAVLDGMAQALNGQRRAPKPDQWETFAARARNPAAVQSLSAVFGEGRALSELVKVVKDSKADTPSRQQALRTLIDAQAPELRTLCESLLDVRMLNTTAVRGLATFEDPALGKQLAQRYRKFYPAERPTVLEVLLSRPAWAAALLDAVGTEKHQVAKTDLTAVHARQILSFKDEALCQKLRSVWGDLRESSADKAKLIHEWRTKLTPAVLAQADLNAGKTLYGICAACHTLYGQGGKIGPDLTGSGRANLDYLLENILDPSGVVSADYRMTQLKLKDGRSLSGVVVQRNAQSLTLRQITEESNVPLADIASEEPSTLSLMPEGLLTALTTEQVRDLLGYLMHR